MHFAERLSHVKRIPVTEEAHREAKAAAAKQGLTLEQWATMMLLRGAKNPGLVDIMAEIGTAANGQREERRS